MTKTPYFDAYERGDRSLSHRRAKFFATWKTLDIAEQIVTVQPMSGPTGRIFQFPIQNFCLEIDV